MPHGNDNRRPVNAKKQGQRNRQAARAAASNSRGINDASPLTGVTPATGRAHGMPSQPSRNPDNDEQKPRAHPSAGNDSLYVSYKMSTQRFKDALQSLVPPQLFASNSVNALMEATDYIVHHQIEVANGTLSDLKYSIRVRKRVALEKYGGGNEGHAYVIEVLEYCWSYLASRRKRKPKVDTSPATKSTNTSLLNRFRHLSTEDDDADDEVDLPHAPLPRPIESGPIRLTLQELIDGTDRTNIILFLMTLDELMGLNATQFSKLKDASSRVREQGLPSSSIVQQMMEASVASNLTIQNVAALEQAFVHDHPHLNTVYRVFANLILTDLVEQLTLVVSMKSPIASHFVEKYAVEFLGDAMECAFRTSSDAHNKQNSLVGKFRERWQFSDDTPVALANGTEMSVQLAFSGAQYRARLEARLEQEKNDAFLGATSHSWVPSSYIGSNRSITHTIRLLQRFSGLAKEHSEGIKLRDASFGTRWLQRTVPATRIQIDMDDLLVNSIFPAAISQCYEGVSSHEIPCHDDLLTGFVYVKAFVDHPERPVSWSLAFTMHTILTAVFEVQEPEHYSFLATTAHDAFHKFFAQLEWTEKSRNRAVLEGSPVPPVFDEEVRAMWKVIQHLVDVPIAASQSREKRLLSVWNPYFAGAFLAYLAYNGNLVGGAMGVDSAAQLRVALHLFNALKQVQAIKPGQIELLDRVFDMFKDCKAIWDGQIPVKGQIQTRWSMLLGIPGGLTRLKMFGMKDKDARKIAPTAGALLSKSFRVLCEHDVDVLADYIDGCMGNQDRHKRYDPIRKLMVRADGILADMSEETQLLGTNLISLGFILHQFYIKLAVDSGLLPWVDENVRNAPPAVKQGADDESLRIKFLAYRFGDAILGRLEAGDVAAITVCTAKMTDYFNGISPSDVYWFQPLFC